MDFQEFLLGVGSVAIQEFLLGQGFQNPFLLMKQNGIMQWFGKDVILPYLIGITIITIIGTAIGYWFTLRLVIIYQKRKLEKFHHHQSSPKSEVVSPKKIRFYPRT